MPPAKLETATPRLKFMIGNALRAGDHHSFNYENEQFTAYLRKKQTHIHNFVSLIAPSIAEPATNGGADEPSFAITIAVTEVGEASDKLSISGPMRYF